MKKSASLAIIAGLLLPIAADAEPGKGRGYGKPPKPPPSPPPAGVLQVGQGRLYQTITDAVNFANADLVNSYVIQVLPGTYTNDFPTINRPVTIEVDPCCVGQSVVLNATIDLPNQKGIILALASLTVNGLTFQGAHISNDLGGNGAGIRDQNLACVSG